MAHSLHAIIRERYGFRCGYCGVSEVESGGELTIDHYVPLSAEGDDEERNLVHACFRCNLYKGDTLPFEGSPRVQKILHPLFDDLTIHLRLDNTTGLLESLTTTGTTHIAILRLNRPALVLRRLQQTLDALQSRRSELLETENRQLREMNSRLLAILNFLPPD